ncbi:MAG: hypothetical protein HDQ88_01775 [Clostridia bacterium]|nr:hypothetical protein [Clostridia bacterium]
MKIREIAEKHNWSVILSNSEGDQGLDYLDFIYIMKDGQPMVFSVEMGMNGFQFMLDDMEHSIARFNVETMIEEVLESVTTLTPEIYFNIRKEVETALLQAWVIWIELSSVIEGKEDLLNLPWHYWN